MKRFAWIAVLATAAWSFCAPAFGQSGAAPEVKEKKDEKRVLEIGQWYPTLLGGLNVTQASYSDNWKGGDKGSVSWAAFLNGTAENQVKQSLNWLSTMKLLYGQTRVQELNSNGDKVWGGSNKSADQIDIETIFRLTRGWAVDPYASFRWESFFQDVTDPLDRKLWLNPMTFKESVGIARKFIDREDQQLLVRTGATARENYRRFFTSSDPSNTGTDAATAWDAGAEVVVDYKNLLSEQLTYTSRLSAYQPFTWSKSDIFDGLGADSLAAAGLPSDISDFTTAVDIDWQNTLSAQVTKIIAVQLYVELLYDKYDNSVVPTVDGANALTNTGAVAAAVRKKGQVKQTLGIGLTYNFK